MNSIQHIRAAFFSHLSTLLSLDAKKNTGDFTLNTDTNRQFGDISSNAALVAAKLLGKPPRTIAQNISDTFTHPLVQRIEIAGPGFINIFLTHEAFVTCLQELYTGQDQFFVLDADTPKKNFNIEFVSANPTGPLHLGHGRGGIIGDVLGNILHFIGQKVTKEFYINDAGNQIQKLGLSCKIRCQQILGEAIVLPEEAYHGEYLVEIAQTCIAQYGTKVIEEPDGFFAHYAKEQLLTRIKTTLKEYGITFDVWFSEKSLHASGAITEALEILQKRGYLYELDGARWFKSTAFGDDKDRVVMKNTGELTYVAADIAYLQNKLARGFDKLVMILGQDHHSYVIRLKAVLQALGEDPNKLDVILYQLVTLKEGDQALRMSKRAGRIISLEDVTTTVGKDVARFFYLNRKADAHLEFDVALALKHSEENPVYYLQYAYVRTNSILEKATLSAELTNITIADAQALTEHEQLLLKKIIALKQVLADIASHYQTHVLTYYMTELAHTFHAYYSATRVIDMTNIPVSRARILVIMQLRSTLELCLHLLGINAPKSM